MCKDDPNWDDVDYGDGKGKCVDMTTDWCQNHGEYSSEAKRACPRTCGVCEGKEINYMKRYMSVKFSPNA